MIDKDKIITMTHLAIYDKNYGEQDRKKISYFRHDYIYKSNIWVRVFALIGCFIITLFYILTRLMFVEEIDVFTINYKLELIRIIIFIAITLVLYSLIGTTIYTVEYQKSKKRLEEYHYLLEQLEEDSNPEDDDSE